MDNKQSKNIEGKSKYQKVEGKLYDYYRYKNEIGKLKNDIRNLENQIIYIDDRMKNVHKYINLDTDITPISIREKVQTSFNSTSYFEKEMENEVTKLERERLDKIKRIHRLDSKIRNMTTLISEVEYSLSLLDIQEQKYIELKYKYDKNMISIAIEMNISQATLYRRRKDILLKLSI